MLAGTLLRRQTSTLDASLKDTNSRLLSITPRGHLKARGTFLRKVAVAIVLLHHSLQESGPGSPNHQDPLIEASFKVTCVSSLELPSPHCQQEITEQTLACTGLFSALHHKKVTRRKDESEVWALLSTTLRLCQTARGPRLPYTGERREQSRENACPCRTRLLMGRERVQVRVANTRKPFSVRGQEDEGTRGDGRDPPVHLTVRGGRCAGSGHPSTGAWSRPAVLLQPLWAPVTHLRAMGLRTHSRLGLRPLRPNTITALICRDQGPWTPDPLVPTPPPPLPPNSAVCPGPG